MTPSRAGTVWSSVRLLTALLLTTAAFHVPAVRLGEAELPVQLVRVCRVQAPAEAGSWTAVDHRRNQLPAEAAAARGRQDEDVRQVGGGHAVGDGSGEADLAPGGRLVRADDAPGGG